MRLFKRFFAAWMLGCLVVLPIGNDCEAKNILWYGNSFTNATCCGSARSVPSIFGDIAVAAGHPAPTSFNAAQDGQSLQWHLNFNTALIPLALPAGQTWDNVVLQDFSTMPTHIGNLSQHLSSSLALYETVSNHSPDVVATMYETWARGYGNAFYPGSFSGPAEMQQELRDGYHMSTDNINATAGKQAAEYAPVGDAWELANWPANFYGDGSYHASSRGSLLNALVLYGTIYDDPTTSDIDLSGVLGSLNLSPADGVLLTGYADAVLSVPEPAALAMLGLGALGIVGRRRLLL